MKENIINQMPAALPSGAYADEQDESFEDGAFDDDQNKMAQSGTSRPLQAVKHDFSLPSADLTAALLDPNALSQMALSPAQYELLRSQIKNNLSLTRPYPIFTDKVSKVSDSKRVQQMKNQFQKA